MAAMPSTHNNNIHGDDYWGYLINPDKSATPRLTQLCEGLAKIISQLDPGPDANLTPQRLSAFYRSVGGDDFVFRELRYPGLSLMYKTLGCFHSLQPTANAFEPPSVPCLLVPGFVRWQTVQLLLQPQEYAKSMQKAVELYDIRAPDGGLFPKTIPREAFPSKPDEAMERWQNTILDRLDDGPKKIKNTPYASPYDAPDRECGYSPRASNHSRRTSRPPRTEPQDLPSRFSPSSRRRSSLSNVPSPAELPDALDANYHWASDQAFSGPNSAIPRSPRPHTSGFPHPPSQSHHRTSNPHRPNTSNPTSSPEQPSKTFNINLDNFHLPFLSSPFSSKKHKHKKRPSGSPAPPSSRPQASRQHEAASTGSEASSEDSLPGFRQFDRERRRASLAPSDAYNRYQRRHSHDASYEQSPAFPSGPGPPPRIPQSHPTHPRPPAAAPHPSAIRTDLFNDDRYRTASAPETPIGVRNPTLRVVDPMGSVSDRGRPYYPQSPSGNLRERRAASVDRRSCSADRRYPGHDGKHSESADRGRRDPEHGSLRKQGTPLRINTVGGSSPSGRRVRTSDIKSAGSPGLRKVPPMSLSGGGRR